jgi:hypothetical protein
MAHADFLFSHSWQDQIISHVAEVGLGFRSLVALYLWFSAPPAMAHADFLFSPDWRDQIISHVAEVGLE